MNRRWIISYDVLDVTAFVVYDVEPFHIVDIQLKKNIGVVEIEHSTK